MPTPRQQALWKAVQHAKLQGTSLRGIARELGISRNKVRRYAHALSPPANRPRLKPEEPAAEPIPESADGHFPWSINADLFAGQRQMLHYPPGGGASRHGVCTWGTGLRSWSPSMRGGGAGASGERSPPVDPACWCCVGFLPLPAGRGEGHRPCGEDHPMGLSLCPVVPQNSTWALFHSWVRRPLDAIDRPRLGHRDSNRQKRQSCAAAHRPPRRFSPHAPHHRVPGSGGAGHR